LEVRFIDNSKGVVADALGEVFQGATKAKVAVAYARHSGLEEAHELRRFADRGGELRFLAGVDFQLTDLGTLETLAHGPTVEARVFCLTAVEQKRNFHPKIYLAQSGDEVRALVGSSNFTTGGLRTNIEANLFLRAHAAEQPARDLVRFHDLLWQSPLAVPISQEIRSAYARLQDRRRSIEASLRREPDYERANAEVKIAVAETVALFAAPEQQITWLLVTNPENYSLCKTAGLWGDEKWGRISQVRQGDLLAFYISGSMSLGCLAIVTSQVFEDRTPHWPDRLYPYRLRFLPLAEPSVFLSFKPLVRDLELFSGIHPKNFGQALQNSQRKLSPKDAARIREVILQAARGATPYSSS
jgi:HKD family nuclease